MNSPQPELQPELLELETRYNELVDAVYSKAITIDDAMRTLQNFQAVDGEGILWGMDSEGNFVSGAPGTQLQITDPSRFRPAQLPMRPGPSTPPWSTSGDLLSPPNASQLQRDGMVAPQFDAAGASLNPAVRVDGNVHTFDPPVKAAKKKKVKTPKAPRNREPGSGVAGLLGRINLGPIGEKLMENKRFLIVILVAVVAVIAIVLTQGEDETPNTTDTIPTSSELGSMPVDGGEPAAAVDPAAVPGQDRVNALISALTSGQRDLSAGAVETPGDEKTIALNTAKYGAWSENYKLSLTAGPVAAVEGGAVADLTLTDTTNSSVLLSGKAQFVPGPSGSWILKTWPEMN